MNDINQLRKATKWLEQHTDANKDVFPVAVNRNGYAEFVAYIFRATVNGKKVWYCVDVLPEWEGPKRIRRICK